jgi:glutaryl-CoA dehydrogenase
LQKFDSTDPFKLSELLTDEEKMVEESAKNYAKDKLLPRIKEAYKNEYFDVEIMKEMGSLGYLGCNLKDYGLPGVSSVAYGLIMKEIERVDSGYRSALSV